MIQIDTADARLLERNEARAYRVERGGPLNAIFDVVENQALHGQFAKWHSVSIQRRLGYARAGLLRQN